MKLIKKTFSLNLLFSLITSQVKSDNPIDIAKPWVIPTCVTAGPAIVAKAHESVKSDKLFVSNDTNENIIKPSLDYIAKGAFASLVFRAINQDPGTLTGLVKDSFLNALRLKGTDILSAKMDKFKVPYLNYVTEKWFGKEKDAVRSVTMFAILKKVSDVFIEKSGSYLPKLIDTLKTK